MSIQWSSKKGCSQVANLSWIRLIMLNPSPSDKRCAVLFNNLHLALRVLPFVAARHVLLNWAGDLSDSWHIKIESPYRSFFLSASVEFGKRISSMKALSGNCKQCLCRHSEKGCSPVVTVCSEMPSYHRHWNTDTVPEGHVQVLVLPGCSMLGLWFGLFPSCRVHLYRERSCAKDGLYQHCFQVHRKCCLALKWGEIPVGRTAAPQSWKESHTSCFLGRTSRCFPQVCPEEGVTSHLSTTAVVADNLLSHTYTLHSFCT